MPMIAVDQIDVPTRQVRRTAGSAEAEAGMEASLRELGVLQPVLVAQMGKRYTLVAGFRRLRAAKAIGLVEVPAEIAARSDESWTMAAQAAENLARLNLPPVDTWRLMAQLQVQGYTMPAIAAMLGLSERRARQYDKLGQLHPELLAEIEAGDMPPLELLGRIAATTLNEQSRAMKAPGARLTWGADQGRRDWRNLAVQLTPKSVRLPRSRAIFDTATADIAWDEDLFAEPGSDGQFTTAEHSVFLKLQSEALAARVASAKKSERLVLTEYDARDYCAKIPKGWQRSYVQGGDLDAAPRRGVTRFVCIAPSGSEHTLGDVIITAAEPIKPAKKLPQPDAADAGGDAEAEPDAEADAPPAPEPRGLTKAGVAMLAAAKTIALTNALTGGFYERDELMRMMLLALSSGTVRVLTKHGGFSSVSFADLRPALVLPAGEVSTSIDVPDLFAAAIGRMLVIPPEGTDPVAEWIGAAINAETELPRFDTAEFLATVPASQLREAAAGIGVKTKKAGELRTQLVGALPDWRPAEARFGAPGPTISTQTEDDA